MIHGTPMFPFPLTYFHMYKTGFIGLLGYFLSFHPPAMRVRKARRVESDEN